MTSQYGQHIVMENMQHVFLSKTQVQILLLLSIWFNFQCVSCMQYVSVYISYLCMY